MKTTNHTLTSPVSELCVPVAEESRAVVRGAVRLEVAVAPLEPSPSTVLVAAAE